MVQYTIHSVKEFIQALLCSELFDSYYLSEGQITTFNTYHIDGHFKKEFFQDIKETEELPEREYSFWKENRNFCFDLIKGKRVPLQFKFVLLLSPAQLHSLLTRENLALSPKNIGGCFLNIQYREGGLTLTSGTALTAFSLDKSLEKAWDKTLTCFLASHNFIS